MKRIIAWTLMIALLASLCACGNAQDTAGKTVDFTDLYAQFADTLPNMISLDEATMANFLGIDAGSCSQVIAAICADGLRADEVWLIEAKDAAALESIKALAEARLASKAQEAEAYSPEQYSVIKNAQLITQGNCLILLVSPDVDALKAMYEAALQ